MKGLQEAVGEVTLDPCLQHKFLTGTGMEASTSRKNPSICFSEERLFTSNLLIAGDWA